MTDWKHFRELIYQKRNGQTAGEATTYRAIEAQLGLPRRSVEKIVQGRAPRVCEYLRLCEWLGVPYTYALDEKCNNVVTNQEDTDAYLV